MGYFNKNNELFLVARRKDMFKYNGYQISPTELEAFIENKFDVQNVIVVGIPDEKMENLPAAVIVLKPNQVVLAQDVSQSIKGTFTYK